MKPAWAPASRRNQTLLSFRLTPEFARPAPTVRAFRFGTGARKSRGQLSRSAVCRGLCSVPELQDGTVRVQYVQHADRPEQRRGEPAVPPAAHHQQVRPLAASSSAPAACPRSRPAGRGRPAPGRSPRQAMRVRFTIPSRSDSPAERRLRRFGPVDADRDPPVLPAHHRSPEPASRPCGSGRV